MSGLGPVCLGGGAAVPLHQGPRHKRRAMCALLIFKLSLASFQQSEKYWSTSNPPNSHTLLRICHFGQIHIELNADVLF